MTQLFLDPIDAHTKDIATLSERIDGLMKPFLPARELLESIQGFSQIIADIFIAATGGDMTQFLEHAMPTAAWNMLSNGEFYRDPGPDYATRHDPARTRARAVKLLEALGYDVTLQQVTQAG